MAECELLQTHYKFNTNINRQERDKYDRLRTIKITSTQMIKITRKPLILA